MPPNITVFGSVNLDLVVQTEHLPLAGQTVSGHGFAQYPGGKGANQALAAQRLGATTKLIAAIGGDANGQAALALLIAGGVDLTAVSMVPDLPTGIAFIAVSRAGENQIVVVPGANAACSANFHNFTNNGALICQLEVPVAQVYDCVMGWDGFVALNLAPAQDVPSDMLTRADLIVVNETEAAFYGEALHNAHGLVAITLGAHGAQLYQGGRLIAQATPPKVTPIDTTGAGDTCVAALVVALFEGQSPDSALNFACAAGALATIQTGAQPSLPMRRAVDAILKSELSNRS